MNERSCPPTNEDTQKLSWQEQETHLLSNDGVKNLPPPELPVLEPPHEKKAVHDTRSAGVATKKGRP
jgi:hypothetical protein